jgi:hypothetical protein
MLCCRICVRTLERYVTYKHIQTTYASWSKPGSSPHKRNCTCYFPLIGICSPLEANSLSWDHSIHVTCLAQHFRVVDAMFDDPGNWGPHFDTGWYLVYPDLAYIWIYKPFKSLILMIYLSPIEIRELRSNFRWPPKLKSRNPSAFDIFR